MANQEIQELQKKLSACIVGQTKLVNRLLIAILADGHLLVEGAPGLAKTKAIKTLGDLIEAQFHRVQFTPDLLPSDITGTEIYRPQSNTFNFQAGPIFHNLILADEINRAPAKVQSALLEAMEERQVSVGRRTFALPDLFLVMATQNPIEQEGTYPLPEAQLDRFLMKVDIAYPDSSCEKKILQLARKEATAKTGGAEIKQVQQRIKIETIFAAREQVANLHMADSVQEYLIQLVIATREPHKYSDELASWLDYGASPRATIALDKCAKAHAWLADKDFVSPDDVQAIAKDVLCHRIVSSLTAQANGISNDIIINKILELVPAI
jgi:MoxR-like ATPase